MARTSANYDLRGERGATFEEAFEYLDEDGAGVDLTSYVGVLQVRELDGRDGLTTDETLVLEATTSNGRLALTQGANGVPCRLALTLSASDMETLNPENERKVKYAYALRVYRPESSGLPRYVIPMVRGNFTVEYSGIRQ